MRWLWKAYETVLHRHPRVTQSLQTGLLVSCGDALSQLFVEDTALKNFSYKRTLQFFAVGAFYVGPALTIWYKVLDTYVGNSGKKVALTKVALDQIVFAPCCLMGFMFIVGGLQGKNLGEIKASVRKNYPDVLIANYKVWPAVQLINFHFVPLRFQVLYAQMIALFWNVYLCFKTKPEN